LVHQNRRTKKGNSMNGNAPAYNLKAVIRETGLTPATIHAWERRYGIFNPKRSPGGHRLFSAEEINLLKWLVARKKEGLSISQAVELWRSHADQPQAPIRVPPVIQPVPEMSEGTLGQLRDNWLAACLDYNEPEAELAMSKALSIASPEAVCAQMLQKGLAELGEGWYAGRVSIQQEHFASALVARRLNALFSVAPTLTHPARLLAACPPGEGHDLSLLMLAFILRWQGWEVIYLGANVSLEHLDATLQAISPQLVLSVAQTLPSASSLSELAKLVSARSIPLAYGGGIFNQISGLVERIPGHFLGRQIDTAPQRIEHLLTSRPPLPVPLPLPSAYDAALAGYREKEAQVTSRVRQLLQDGPIAPRYIELANTHFAPMVDAALALGEMAYLDDCSSWLNGLLENYSLSPTLAVQYYKAFHQAIQEQLGLQAGPVLAWLGRFEKMS
jgi:MerR family transcriptional regulator, light-induced transcriptional regulator